MAYKTLYHVKRALLLYSDENKIRRRLLNIESTSALHFFVSVYMTSRLVAKTRGVEPVQVELTARTSRRQHQIQRRMIFYFVISHVCTINWLKILYVLMVWKEYPTFLLPVYLSDGILEHTRRTWNIFHSFSGLFMNFLCVILYDRKWDEKHKKGQLLEKRIINITVNSNLKICYVFSYVSFSKRFSLQKQDKY